MLETNLSLLPQAGRGKVPKAVIVGLEADSLDELEGLLKTLEIDTVARVLMPQGKVNPATYLGKGKVEEVLQAVQLLQADCVVADVDLTPNQLKNLENEIKKPVLDRSGVIIEIFSRHARTREAKVQVELARLQYLLPRLTHFWTHFERQRGGIGLKGMGEKQIEVDRRLVKKRMSILRDRLKEIANERKVRRVARERILKVALVGYTNAGKSTLLNGLTHSQVLAEDKLFATLDPSVRALDPFSHPPVVAIDTVGFISRLPPALVASFRSTLEEVQDADLILHVVDGSSPSAKEQIEVTESILKDLEVDGKPRITLLNKMDLVENKGGGEKRAAGGSGPVGKRGTASPSLHFGRRNLVRLISPGALAISSFNTEDLDQVRKLIVDHFKKSLETWEMVIPYSEGKLESQLHAYGVIESSKHFEKGTFYKVKISEAWAKKLQLKKYGSVK